MKFLPHKFMSGSYRIIEVEPAHQHLLMPHTSSLQVKGSFGSVISQVFPGTDYEVRQHHFFIDQQVTLDAHIPKPILTINYMLKGSPVASLNGMGNVSLEEQTYQMFYVPSASYPALFNPGEYHCLHINFSPSYLKRMTNRHPKLREVVECAIQESKDIVVHANGKVTGNLKLMLDSIIRPNTCDQAEMDLHVKAKVIEMLLLFIRTHHAVHSDVMRIDNNRMIDIREYIDNNLSKNLCISDMASHFGIGESTLRRAFSKTYGMPIYQYIQECRMQRAKLLLQQGGMTISEISDELGFQNYSAFTRAFTKFYGIPPVQYGRSIL